MNSSQFNARNASASQIAKSFVVPEYFSEVTSFRNVVLVGPRGIGKTTLLKAITAPGLLGLHRRPDLAEVLSGMDFEYLPIYIPAESIWKGTANLVKQTFSQDADQKLILGGLFTDHCLYQLISAFEEAAILQTSLNQGEKFPWAIAVSDDQEAKIASHCSELWELPKPQKSFLGVKLQLLKRANLYRASIAHHVNPKALEEVREIGHLDFLVMLKGFMDIASKFAGVNRWTISFDEMEIAPKSILSHLYENLRSFDQRAALKFSLFPFVDFYEEKGGFIPNPSSPIHGQDFHPVILSNKFSNPDYTFAKKLIQSECEARGQSYGEFKSYLNKSSAIYANTRKFSDNGFERQPDKIYQCSMSKGDTGFKKYMQTKGIVSPEDVLSVSGEARRANVIRKVFPIAEIRSYYLSKPLKRRASNGSRTVRRVSAKGYGYYHGFDQFLNLTEGNPRAIKYYLNELLSDMDAQKESRIAQNAAIPRNVDRFRALIASQTVPSVDVGGATSSALKVVDALGHALAESLLGTDFQPEPALSYELKNVKPEIREALISAINSGALVVEQNASGKKLLFELEGCRVRLSHRLSPYYKLPTISGQSRVLSGLPETKESYDHQPDLLAWADADG